MLNYENWKNNFKKNKNGEIIKKPKYDGDESISSLIDDYEKGKQPSNDKNTKGLISNKSTTLSTIPVIYLVTSILTIIAMLVIKKLHDSENNRTDTSFSSTNSIFKSLMRSSSLQNIPDYHDIIKFNRTIFCIYSGITSICGLAIVFVLYSVLKQRFKVPEYKDSTYKIYIMALFGTLSNSLNFLKGLTLYMETDILKNLFGKNEIESSQILFLSLIFFSILFTVYSIKVLSILNANKSEDCRVDQDESWFHYKIVILTYLVSFTFIYVFFLMYDKQVFIFSGILNEIVLDNTTFVMKMFPYFIHIINAILMFSFYFELRYVNLILSKNLEVDYLFDDAEKRTF